MVWDESLLDEEVLKKKGKGNKIPIRYIGENRQFGWVPQKRIGKFDDNKVPKNKRIAFEHARRLLNGEAIEGYGDEWKGVLAQKVAAEDGESRTAAKQGSKVAAEEVRSNEKSNIKGDNIKSVASSKKATGKGKKNAPKKQADRNRSHRKQDSTKKQTKDKNTVKEEELSSHADVQGESKKKSNLTKTTREEVMGQPTGEELRALIEEKMEDIFKNRRDELMEKNEFTKKGESSVQREQPEVNERIQEHSERNLACILGEVR